MKTLIITIDRQGQVTTEAQGFAGAECKAATKIIQDKLGIVLEDLETSDMYRTEKAHVNAGF